jgi:glycosyltransferase involved in cell wall biosynthesis
VELAAAPAELGEPYRLCVLGQAGSESERIELGRRAAAQARLVERYPIGRLPAINAAADLVVVGAGSAAAGGPPPEAIDALAMGTPVLAAEDSEALAGLIQAGAVAPRRNGTLSGRIGELFADPAGLERQRELARRYFTAELGHDVALRALDGVLDAVRESRRELPRSWGRAYEVARRGRARAGRPADRRSRVPPTTTSWDIVSFWRLPYSGIYGRRADMLTKHFALSDRTRRLVHFDKPTDWAFLESRRAAARSGVNHFDLIARRGRRLAFTAERDGKRRSYMFVARQPKDPPRWQRRLLPSADAYLGYIGETLERNQIGRHGPVIFWVWPPDIDFAPMHRAFQPTITVADVVDDERSWHPPGSAHYEQVTRTYETVFGLSDLVVTHNDPLAERLRWFGVKPQLVPNATELFPGRAGRRPRELRHLNGPIIGYSGTLSWRIDLELIDRLARERRDCHIVIVGSTHGPEQVLSLDRHPNVHFLGVRTYPDVTRYIRSFDVAIIPHLDDEMSRGMNPLKGYLYAACGVPAVATNIANLDLAELDGVITVTDSHDEFVAAIDRVLEARAAGALTMPSNDALQAHTWSARVRQIESLIDEVLA